MAIIKTGSVVGQISGRVGGNVFSRNRGGAYVRNGSIPTRSTTPYAEAAKQRLADWSKAWALLTNVQQLGWKNWAVQNPVINRLGDAITLSGHQAYVQLNINIALASGTAIDDPPVVAPPTGLLTLTATYDIGAGNFGLAFTPSPIGTNNTLMVECAVVDNPGVKYVQNLFKLIAVTPTDITSPQNGLESAVEARFGTLIVGQQVYWRITVLDSVTGLKSQAIITNGVVIST